jgi:hypothetical protein
MSVVVCSFAKETLDPSRTRVVRFEASCGVVSRYAHRKVRHCMYDIFWTLFFIAQLVSEMSTSM